MLKRTLQLQHRLLQLCQCWALRGQSTARLLQQSEQVDLLLSQLLNLRTPLLTELPDLRGVGVTQLLELQGLFLCSVLQALLLAP